MSRDDPQAPLRGFQPRHEFFVGIDSDGCAFDTMEIKHKECFIPNIIKHWGLQAVSKYAREAAEFVNLYSKWRGINRFPALLMVFDLLADRGEVQRRGVKMPEVPSLRKWVETESKLGNPALEAAAESTRDAVFERTLAWSEAVNAAVAATRGQYIAYQGEVIKAFYSAENGSPTRSATGYPYIQAVDDPVSFGRERPSATFC